MSEGIKYTRKEKRDTDIVELETEQIKEFTRQLEVHIESDEEVEESFGYQQLPQDEDECWEQLESDNEESNGPMQIELEPSHRIDSETCDLIKSIMSKVQLSEQAIPDWAKQIPESSWLPRTEEK
ncbi:hypothetical protein BY458DRAFT_515692 [Sporodiniella umbellata]|nr:hypothetical protein BY458DRAFT_515692 [Sporodiniella umbellata]